MKALISPNENNRICDIEQNEFPVSEPLFWVDCSDDVTRLHTYIDGKFIAPVPVVEVVTVEPTLAELKAQLLAIQAQIAKL